MIRNRQLYPHNAVDVSQQFCAIGVDGGKLGTEPIHLVCAERVGTKEQQDE